MPIKDALEMLVQIFHRDGPQLVKDPADFHAIIGMGVASIRGGHQQPIGLLTVLVQVGRVVMAIPQHEADVGRNLAQQSGRRLAIGGSGGSQHGSNGKPDRRDDRDDVQFPAVDPAVPARVGPVGFGINRGMGKLPFLAMLLMPDASSGSQNGAIDGDGASTRAPGLDQADQMAAQAANLRRQGRWDRFLESLPGPARWEAVLLRQQVPQGAHVFGRLG